MSSNQKAGDVNQSARREWLVPYSMFLLLILFEAMDSNAFGPIIVQIRDEFNLSATEVGLYSSAGSLFGLLITIPVGELIRRRGYRLAGASTSAFIFAGALVSYIAPTFLVAVFGRILTMCGTRGCLLVGQAGGITVSPKEIRNTAWSVLISMISVGGAFGAFVVGGYIGGTYGWRNMMLLIACSGVILGVIYFVVLKFSAPELQQGEPDREDRPGSLDDEPAKNPYRIWALYVLGLAFALSTAGMTVNTTFASVVAKDSWNLGTQYTGFALGLGQIISLPVTIMAGILADRYLSRRLVITVLVVVTGAGAFVQLAALQFGADAGGPTWFTIGLVMCFIGKAGGGMLYACVPDFLKPGSSLGPAYAVLSLVSLSGYVIEPLLAGILRDATGNWELVFVIFGVAPFGGLLLIRWLKVR